MFIHIHLHNKQRLSKQLMTVTNLIAPERKQRQSLSHCFSLSLFLSPLEFICYEWTFSRLNDWSAALSDLFRGWHELVNPWMYINILTVLQNIFGENVKSFHFLVNWINSILSNLGPDCHTRMQWTNFKHRFGIFYPIRSYFIIYRLR